MKENAPFSGFYPFRRHTLDHLEKAEEKDTVDCKASYLHSESLFPLRNWQAAAEAKSEPRN